MQHEDMNSTKRRRNFWLVQANELVRKRNFAYDESWITGIKGSGLTHNDTTNAYGALDHILIFAEKYKEETYDKAVVLKNEEGKLKILPYRTRFSNEYYDKPFSDLSLLKKIEQWHTSIFLTLTVDPKRYFCMKDAYEGLMKEWNRLRTWIRKHDSNPLTLEANEIAKNWNGEYVSVVEFQNEKTKLPHLHILLLGCSWLDVNRVRDQWARHMGFSTFFRVELVKPIWIKRKDGRWFRYTAIDYILKYMRKASQNKEHLALLWAVNARAYNCSHGLIGEVKDVIFNSRSEDFKLLFGWIEGIYGHKWEYVGTFPLEIVQDCKTIDDLERALVESL